MRFPRDFPWTVSAISHGWLAVIGMPIFFAIVIAANPDVPGQPSMADIIVATLATAAAVFALAALFDWGRWRNGYVIAPGEAEEIEHDGDYRLARDITPPETSKGIDHAR